MSAANRCARLISNDKLNSVKDAYDVAGWRTEIRYVQADYNQVSLPPRFATADSYVRKSLDDQDAALAFLETAYRTGDSQTMAAGRSHYVDAGDLMTKAFDEIDRVTKTP